MNVDGALRFCASLDHELMNDEDIFVHASNQNATPAASSSTKTISEPSGQQHTQSKNFLFKPDMDALLNDYRPVSNQPYKKPALVTISPTVDQSKSKQQASTESQQQNSLISNRRFYSNRNDKENTRAFDLPDRACTSNKRLHSPPPNDENRLYTPKRSCQDKFDAANKLVSTPSPLPNLWNRTNSMSKTSGKG